MIREHLAKTFGGDVLVPGDPGYDAARSVWNAIVDRRPRLIARCRNVADVRAAVRAARDLNLEIGVRCGGHSVVGLAVPDDGLMIDLTPMGAVRVDPIQKRGWVQGAPCSVRWTERPKSMGWLRRPGTFHTRGSVA